MASKKRLSKRKKLAININILNKKEKGNQLGIKEHTIMLHKPVRLKFKKFKAIVGGLQHLWHLIYATFNICMQTTTVLNKWL